MQLYIECPGEVIVYCWSGSLLCDYKGSSAKVFFTCDTDSHFHCLLMKWPPYYSFCKKFWKLPFAIKKQMFLTLIRDQGGHGLLSSMCCSIVLLEMPVFSFIDSVSCSYIGLISHFKKLSHSLCSNITSHLCFYTLWLHENLLSQSLYVLCTDTWALM